MVLLGSAWGQTFAAHQNLRNLDMQICNYIVHSIMQVMQVYSYFINVIKCYYSYNLSLGVLQEQLPALALCSRLTKDCAVQAIDGGLMNVGPAGWKSPVGFV